MPDSSNRDRGIEEARNVQRVHEFQDRGDIDALLNELQRASGGSRMRKEAARALGYLGDSRAVEPIAALLKEPDELSRVVAARALGRLGDQRAVAALLSALKDSSFTVQWSAAGSLAELRAEEAVEPLQALLASPHRNVRRTAAYALGEIGDQAAIPALLAAKRDERMLGRRHFRKAIRKLRTRAS